MFHKRLFTLLLLFVFLVLGIRLINLQILETDYFQNISRGNILRSFKKKAARGVIYDRYGTLMATNRPRFNAFEIKHDPFRLEIFRKGISLKEAIRLEEEGKYIEVRPVRVYPQQRRAAHILGYVGEISSAELNSFKPGDVIGKAGIEAYYDHYLRGQDGIDTVAVNARGRIFKRIYKEKVLSGANITLTLDLELQKEVERLLYGRRGAIVILKVDTGEILAMASYPSYNPNIFSRPIKDSEWQRLIRYGYPFLNRALTAYPPGSVFKPVTMMAALSEGLATASEVLKCEGYTKVGQRIFFCWKRDGHQKLTVKEGLVQSCNVVFYDLGLRLGPELLSRYAHLFGFGKKTGVDLLGELKGTVPDRRLKLEKYQEIWYPGDSLNFGIGQGYLQVTPLQLASLYALIANGEQAFVPRMVLKVEDQTGKTLYQSSPQVRFKLPVSQEILKSVREGLRDVVLRGTGKRAFIKGLPMAGKTGTAEDPPRDPHAWFAGYAPFDKPEISFAIFLEEGKRGDLVPPSIAKELVEWYQNNRNQ